MIILTGYPNYPTEWAEYQDAKKSRSLPPWFPRYELVNRFGARYRAAKSYEGGFQSYSDKSTANGYDALIRLTLAFSALEYYYKFVCKTNLPGIRHIFEMHHRELYLNYASGFKQLIVGDDPRRFFELIRPHLDKPFPAVIERVLEGKSNNVIKALQGVRHGFIHGHVTPNMGQVQAGTVIEICSLGSDFLLDLMDAEFSRLLRDG